jgi:hypothetical protein
VTYKGKLIKLGFAINIANPALNLYPALAMQSDFSKTGKLQFKNRITLSRTGLANFLINRWQHW